uniref:Platelet-derived growth factor (PDGF) family profile domain-containing protein n=1 Tax=Neolamprologus brichardi TaxID=32507 RepID=A0A3Q4GE20_NEOBR
YQSWIGLPRARTSTLLKQCGIISCCHALLAVFSVILEEIQRTSCQPREVCIEVAKEYPESTSQFYLPHCVALHRCGGCCNNEAFYCTNTSYALVNKTVSHAPRVSILPPCQTDCNLRKHQVMSRACGRARSSTQTPAGRCKKQSGVHSCYWL